MITYLTSGTVDTALTYSAGIAKAEAALTLGAQVPALEAVMAECNSLMQRVVDLLVAYTDDPQIAAIRHEREL